MIMPVPSSVSMTVIAIVIVYICVYAAIFAVTPNRYRLNG
jgi:hypothetical protein